jgi:uncharacterized OB-fold protein
LETRLIALPELTAESTAYWTGGAHGELMIAHCEDCGKAIHPPQLVCPKCLSRQVTPRKVAGTGTVYTYTVNHQAWIPDMPVPYVLAVVDLDDVPGVRVTARLEVAPETVQIGQKVRIGFTPSGDVWLPHWLPLEQGHAA